MSPLPDPSSVNVAETYTVEGASYKGLLETAHAVRRMQGKSGIEVKVSDAIITVGLAGTENVNATNGAVLVWGTQALNVCINNTPSTIYVLAATPLGE